MDTSVPIQSSENVLKFLKDPEVSSEVKYTCVRLLRNPFIKQLLKRTPIAAMFEICQEYKRHPDLYDDIFCGRIKFFSKALKNEALPLFNYKEIDDNCNLENFIGPTTLPGQVVEKFAVCNAVQDKIKRIRVKIQGTKMLTAAFDSKNKIVSMLVDPIDKDYKNDFINFLNNLAEGMVDLIRV